MKRSFTIAIWIVLVGFASLALAGNLDRILIQRALNGTLPEGSVSTAEMADDSVTPAKMADGDFGDFTVSGNSAGLDSGVVESNEVAAGSINPVQLAGRDFGDFIVAAGVASLDNGTDGTVVAAAGSATESSFVVKQTRISFTNVQEVATDTSDEGESQKIFDLPDGPIVILNAVANLSCVTLSGATNTFVCSIGTAAAGDDSSLTSTEANIVPSTELDTTAGTVLTNAFDAVLAAPVTIDGTATAVDLYFNWAIDDDDMEGDVTNTVTGDVEIQYVVGLDNQ